MTFGDLVASVTADIFPDGEPENLVVSHLKSFKQAMVDLQAAVPCYRFGNTDFYPACSTYFNCGLTVLPKPQGNVIDLYTIGKKTSASQNAQVADTTVQAPFLQLSSGVLSTPVTSGTLGTIPSDGIYTISVNQTNSLSSIYPANSPQYILTAISYTDVNGNPQTVQPAPTCHVSDSAKSGALSIDCQAGSLVAYTITPYNIPQADAIISVEMTLTSGASGVSDDDWCSRVYYEQVEYGHIEKYVRACKNCDTSSSIWSAAAVLVGNIFGNWRIKRRYTPPTDVGFEGLQALPNGFHYPQTSTDVGGRSRGGVFAIKHGRIYVAPWIESTESVIVEWNGTKTNWNASDLVTDEPTFYEAVKLMVAISHYTDYEENDKRLNDFKKKLYGEPGIPGTLRKLILACREKNRQRSPDEIGAADSDAAEGIGVISGATSNTGVYYSAVQSYTANCSAGQTGNPATATIPAGQYQSTLSQADADAKALAAATSSAQAQLSCVAGGTFTNSAQTFTASCPAALGSTPAASGSSVTITIAAGSYASAISQAVADASAMAAAKATAQGQLSCTFLNAPQTATSTCSDNSIQQVTIPAGAYTSTVSQADADGKALSAAQTQAANNCTNSPGSVFVGNTAVNIVTRVAAMTTCGQLFVPVQIVVPANTFVAQATAATKNTVLSLLNAQATALANQKLQAAADSAPTHAQLQCYSNVTP